MSYAERDGAEEVCSADAELLAAAQSGRHNGATWVRLRRRVRIIGLVGMSQHAIGESRFDWTAYDIGSNHGGDFLAAVGASELQCTLARKQVATGNHGGKGVQDVVLGFLRDFFGRERLTASLM